MKDVDIIASAINGDKQVVIQDQLSRIQIEIVDRLAINIQHREALHELIDDLRKDILELHPAHLNAPDENRHERYVLKREWRQLVLRLLEEQRACWADRQSLNTEARRLEADLLTLRQRDRRLSEFT